MSRSGALRISLCFSIVGGAFVLACTTDYQKGLEDPNFGGPNALAGQTQPGPTSALTADSGGGSSSGETTPSCVTKGGTLVDAGACTVSFKNDVLTAFTNAGCQAVGCHGGETPQNQPRIDPNQPGATWNEFAAFQLSNGKPYVNPCSAETAASTIACNVNLAQGCGTVMPQTTGLPADVVTMIETWVKCGAPNN